MHLNISKVGWYLLEKISGAVTERLCVPMVVAAALSLTPPWWLWSPSSSRGGNFSIPRKRFHNRWMRQALASARRASTL